MFLRSDDVSRYFKLLDFLFWGNAIVCFVQYFVFGIYGDWLGGIFGTTTGCNSYTNMFFVIISIKTIIFTLNKKENIWSCIAKFGVMFVLAAFAEIKFFYIIFALIVVMSVVFTDFSWRKFTIVILGLGGLVVGAYVLTIVFPNSSGFLSIESIFDYASSENGYTASGDINRLTAVPIISERFLTDDFSKFFGLGLGNCDTSAFAICNTPFYMSHMDMHYTWFSSAFLFLETGFIGLALNLSFFITCLVFAMKRKKEGTANLLFCQIGIVFSILCMILTFYNSSLRMEVGYIAYFALALPVLSSKNQ